MLSFGHLFGLYNPNQLASALRIPKSRLYRHLTELNSNQWKRVVIEIVDAKGVNLRAYPTLTGGDMNRRITFDSWDGSHPLIEALTGRGFESILIHGKNNYVMRIDKRRAKLSVHKQSVTLCENQWGCNKPVYRARAASRTFGSVVVLFFSDMGQMRTMLVFGKSLGCAEILKIWGQHHGIEQFWRLMKSNMKVSANCGKDQLSG